MWVQTNQRQTEKSSRFNFVDACDLWVGKTYDVRVSYSPVSVHVEPSANSMRLTLELSIYDLIMAYVVHYAIRMEVTTCHMNMTDILALTFLLKPEKSEFQFQCLLSRRPIPLVNCEQLSNLYLFEFASLAFIFSSIFCSRCSAANIFPIFSSGPRLMFCTKPLFSPPAYKFQFLWCIRDARLEW